MVVEAENIQYTVSGIEWYLLTPSAGTILFRHFINNGSVFNL
jgi:hypothetical protein